MQTLIQIWKTTYVLYKVNSTVDVYKEMAGLVIPLELNDMKSTGHNDGVDYLFIDYN